MFTLNLTQGITQRDIVKSHHGSVARELEFMLTAIAHKNMN